MEYDVMDMAVFDRREYTALAAYDSGLFAVMNITSADYVAADAFFQPPVILSAAYGVAFHLGGAFYLLVIKIHIIFDITVFTE